MEIFHTLNRGVDKRQIFMDDKDHFRFVHDLFEFNDQENVNTTFRAFSKLHDIECRTVERKPRKRLVDIHAFCLMPNHYHLLLTPRVANAIPKFMKKLNMGYARYFNEKYKRNGALFQGRYKSIGVFNDVHFNYLPTYIHFNPLDLITPEWRKNQISDFKKSIDFLKSYRWSSYLDYIGLKNFPSVTNRNFLLDCFGGTKDYERQMKERLKEMDFVTIKDITLE